MDYRVGEVFGVRVAGLPVGGLEGLRFTRTWELVDRLITAEETGEVDRLITAEETGEKAGEEAGDGEPDAGLSRTLAAELAEKAEALRVLACDEDFRRGLAAANPELSAELDGWLARPGEPPERPVLGRLARYAARAATRTSPYAATTISGLGHWDDDGGPAMTPPDELRRSVVPEVDLGTVSRVWEALAKRPGLREAVRVRVNPSLRQEDGWLWFLGAGPEETPVRMPAEPMLAGLLAWVRNTPAPTVGGLERAAASSGLVARLLAAGLLERRRPFADQALDPIADLAAWVEEVLPDDSSDRPWLPTALREVEQAPRERIRDVTGWLLARLGDTADLTVRNVRLETAVSPEPPAVCGRAAWEPVFRDLNTVRRLAAVFDPDLPVKLTAAEHFVRSHGEHATVPFVRFYHDAHLLDRGSTPAGPAVRELARLRRETCEILYGGSTDARGVVVADPDLVDKMAASWPRHLRPPGSITCHGHLLPGPEFVVNAVTAGYGRGIGRIRHLLALAGVSAPAVEPRPVAECLGGFGAHLNLRPASGAAIDYPFTVTGWPALSVADLRVSYDPGSLRLVLSDGDGNLVLPAHLGLAGDATLPPAWSFLVRVFGEPSTALPDPWEIGGSADEPCAWPRLQVGRVVLVRAGWRMSAADLPMPAAGEPDAAYVTRTARWLERRRIPRRFFARLAAARPGSLRRPFFVDVTDHFLLLSLARAAARRGGPVVLEEALPDPSHAPSYGPHGQRVTEYALDVSAGDP
ncbi:lantibiotic dehydratase [Nonomuraea sp. NPDC048916]|uniref:lantibiotic dehydratase n=1 Tax=Nonomuraea sp. NPDC048916 TaxID=3154232 RepID=UPI00340DD156